MRLFFAASTLHYQDALIENKVKNVLFAYPYATNSLLRNFDEYIEKVKGVNLIFDSGAFSVWTLGKKIEFDEYLNACQKIIKKYKHKLHSLSIVNLDVIPGEWRRKPTKEEVEESAKLGRENFLRLKDKGIMTIPVFHQHEEMEWLYKMEKDADYIGISPANDLTTKQRIPWMDKVYSYLKDRIKTHSFGGISKSLLERYPLFSGDGSSWSSLVRFGQSIRHSRGGKIGAYEKASVKHGGKKAIYFLAKDVRTYLKLEKYITDLWKARGVEWKE